MSYRKKIYVSFDADDILYFNMLQAWLASDTQEIVHHTLNSVDSPSQRIAENISNSLKEKIRATSCFIVLVSEHTVSLGSQMKTEIEKAIELGKPIIVANLNGKRSIDKDLCPTILHLQLAVHLSFNAKIIQRAIDTWPTYYELHKDNSSGAHFFKPEVYKNLGL